MKGKVHDLTHFPGGAYIEGFWDLEYCDVLSNDLSRAIWVPAMVAKYDGNDFKGVVHDEHISTALVSKDFRFNPDIFELSSLQSQVDQVLSNRFALVPGRYSNYGVSKYPVGS